MSRNTIHFQDLIDLEVILSEREEKWVHERLDWSLNVAQLIHEGRFEIQYRMSLHAFNKLCSLLHPRLRRKSNMSRSRLPINTTIIVGISLRYLAGGPSIISGTSSGHHMRKLTTVCYLSLQQLKKLRN